MGYVSNFMRSCYENVFGVEEPEVEIDERVQLRERIGEVVSEYRVLLNYATMHRMEVMSKGL